MSIGMACDVSWRAASRSMAKGEYWGDLEQYNDRRLRDKVENDRM